MFLAEMAGAELAGLVTAVIAAIYALIHVTKKMIGMLSDVFTKHTEILVTTNEKLTNINTSLDKLHTTQADSNKNFKKVTEILDSHISDDNRHLTDTDRQALNNLKEGE